MASITSYTTKKGTRYRVDIYGGVDPATGKQINITKKGFLKRKDADNFAKKKEYELSIGRAHVTSVTPTYQEVYEE